VRVRGISITNVALVGLIVSVLVQAVQGYAVPRTTLFFRSLVLLTVGVLASWFARNELESARLLVALTGLIAGTCAIVASARNTSDYARIRRAFLWMGALAAVSAIGEVIVYALFALSLKQGDAGVGFAGIPITVQASGLADGNAHLALFIVPSLVLAWMTRSKSPDPGERWRLLAYVGMLSLATIATLSRAAILTVLVFGAYRAVAGIYHAWGPAVASMVLCAFLIGVLVPGSRFLFSLSPESVYARFGLLIGSAQLAAERPLLGAGLGTRSRAAAGFSAGTKGSIGGYDVVDLAGYQQEREAHNTFVQIVLDMGIIGLVAYLAILAGVWRDARGVELAYPALIAALFTNVFAVFNSLLYTKPIWFVLGLCAASVVGTRAEFPTSRAPIHS